MNQFDKQNPSLFKFGIFYYNKNDADLFVPKPTDTGWTVNFARPGAWVFVGLILAIAVAAEIYFK
jgi:uncharacterized membrane protein